MAFLNGIVKALGLDPNDRALARYRKTVDIINSYEGDVEKLSDEELARSADIYNQRLENGETLADILEYGLQVLAQLSAVEDGGFGGHVVLVFTGFCAEVHDLALVYDDHALSVGDSDDGTVGDHVIVSVVGGTSADLLLSLGDENICGDRFTIEVLFPLICQYSAGSTCNCFDKTHVISPFVNENVCF